MVAHQSGTAAVLENPPGPALSKILLDTQWRAQGMRPELEDINVQNKRDRMHSVEYVTLRHRHKIHRPLGEPPAGSTAKI